MATLSMCLYDCLIQRVVRFRTVCGGHRHVSYLLVVVVVVNSYRILIEFLIEFRIRKCVAVTSC